MTMGLIVRKLLFGDDAMVPYDVAIEAKEKAFKGLACAYCFLLLHVSTITRNLAKERLFFEVFTMYHLYSASLQLYSTYH